MKTMWLAGLALSAGLAFAGTASAQDITVGVAGPMTGAEASFGTQLKNGAEAAIADINAAGGVLGKKLALEHRRRRLRSQAGARGRREIREPEAAVRRRALLLVVVDPGVGGLCRRRRRADHARRSTNPTFTDRNLWNTFRICGRDDQQGEFAGDYVAKNYKGKNVAILHDKTTYGKGLADEMKKALNKAGVKEKLYEAYNKGDKDFNALVSKLKAAASTSSMSAATTHEAGLILRQMRDQGMKSHADGRATPSPPTSSASITGPAAKACVHLRPRSAQAPDSQRAIVKKFKDKGIDPEGYTLYTYAAFQVWAAAAKKANTTDRKKVAEAMQRRQLGHGARPDQLRQEGRHHRASTTCSIAGSKDGNYDEIPAEQGLVISMTSRMLKSPPRQPGGLLLCDADAASADRLPAPETSRAARSSPCVTQPVRKAMPVSTSSPPIALSTCRDGARKRARNAANGSTAKAASRNGMPSPANRPRAGPRPWPPSPPMPRPQGSRPGSARCRASSRTRRQAPSHRRPTGRPAWQRPSASPASATRSA